MNKVIYLLRCAGTGMCRACEPLSFTCEPVEVLTPEGRGLCSSSCSTCSPLSAHESIIIIILILQQQSEPQRSKVTDLT